MIIELNIIIIIIYIYIYVYMYICFNRQPHPHYRAPCMKYVEGSVRPIYLYPPEHMSRRGHNSGGVGGEVMVVRASAKACAPASPTLFLSRVAKQVCHSVSSCGPKPGRSKCTCKDLHFRSPGYNRIEKHLHPFRLASHPWPHIETLSLNSKTLNLNHKALNPKP